MLKPASTAREVRVRRHLRELFAYLVAHRAAVAVALLSSAALLAALVVVPQWTATLINQVLPGGNADRLRAHLAMGLGLALVICIASYGRDHILTSLSAGFAASLRDRMVARLLRQPNVAGSLVPVGERLAHVGNDVVVLQHAMVRGLAIGVPNLVTAICLLAVMFATSVPLTLGTLAMAIPMLCLVALFGRRIHGVAHQSQRTSADLLGVLGEALDGLREAKVFGREALLEQRVRSLSEATLASTVREERMSALHPAAVTFVGMIGLAGLVLLTATARARGVVDGEAMVRFLVLLGLSVGPLQESTRSTGAIARFFAVMDRISAMLDVPIEEDAPGAISCPRLRGRVTFDGVAVARAVSGFTLGPFSLSIGPDEVVAIVGASGSGKSTMLDLVTRLVEPTEGAVRVDGRDIRELQRASLREQIALLPQEPLLFRGSVVDNIRFACPTASDAEVQAAVRSAHVDEFASRLPRGIETLIEPRGANLSVGQRQRIALARALLRDPRILLLDEPSAALDIESELLLHEALRHFCANRTTLLVTHRSSLLSLADRIVVLDGGKMVHVGTATQLRQRGAPLAILADDRAGALHA